MAQMFIFFGDNCFKRNSFFIRKVGHRTEADLKVRVSAASARLRAALSPQHCSWNFMRYNWTISGLRISSLRSVKVLTHCLCHAAGTKDFLSSTAAAAPSVLVTRIKLPSPISRRRRRREKNVYLQR